MSDQRVGRHIRIYEWDEVDLNEDTPTTASALQNAKTTQVDKKAAPDSPKRLSALLKKKLF